MTDVEQIKSKIDIVNFISEYVSLKKAGRSFKANCPFHHEKTPSFVVSPERQSWHCFGACNMGGDAISFLEKWENIEFVEALKMLAIRTGITLSQFVPTDSSRLKEKLYEINHLASEFYHYILTSHLLGKRAKEYVKTRDIKDETMNTFLLGYAPSSWDSLLKFLLKKGYTQEDIYSAGLLSKSSQNNYFDRFRGRLMFPLKDPRGNIVGFAGRVLPPASEKEAKYINTSETPVYIKGNMLYGLDVTKEAIKKEKEAVIVEGEIDAITSFQAGVGNVVAIKGSALTEGQVLLLKRYTDQIKLALDSDFAGNEAARRGIEIADNAGLAVHVVELSIGKDPAECISKGPHLWKDSVKKAVPIYDFLIHTSLKKYDKSDVFGKKKIAEAVLPFIAKINNLIVQSHYIKKLARELDVGEESISQSIRSIQQKGFMIPTQYVQKVQKDRVAMLEEHVLTLILQSNSPKKSFQEASGILEDVDFTQPAIIQIWKDLASYFSSNDEFDVKSFGKLLSHEYLSLFDRLYLTDIESTLSKIELFQHELVRTVQSIKSLSLRRRMHIIATNIKRAEESGDEKEAEILRSQSKQLLSQMKEVENSGSFQVQ